MQKRPRIIKPRSSPVTEDRGFDLILIAIGLHLCFSLSPYDCIQRRGAGNKSPVGITNPFMISMDLFGAYVKLRTLFPLLSSPFCPIIGSSWFQANIAVLLYLLHLFLELRLRVTGNNEKNLRGVSDINTTMNIYAHTIKNT